MATTFLRVREPGKHAILNPETGLHETPDPTMQYTSSHPLVKAAPWAFGTDEEIAAAADARRNIASVPQPVEAATANPGERRTTRRA